MDDEHIPVPLRQTPRTEAFTDNDIEGLRICECENHETAWIHIDEPVRVHP